jgi:hypothetical protein
MRISPITGTVNDPKNVLDPDRDLGLVEFGFVVNHGHKTTCTFLRWLEA